MFMLTLGFDTATEIGTVGLVDGGEVLGEYTFQAGESQSEKLLSAIDLLLRELEKKVTDVKKIAVSRGPGSFTGLRIGISTAKGLAHGLEVPLVGVPLTNCYLSRVNNYSGPVFTLIKDRRNLIYLAGFDDRGEKVIEERSTSIEKLEEVIIDTTESSKYPVLLVGDAVPGHREKLRQIDKVRLTKGSLNYPSGLELAMLGESIEPEGNELASLEPLYAQRPIAEINWNDN